VTLAGALGVDCRAFREEPEARPETGRGAEQPRDFACTGPPGRVSWGGRQAAPWPARDD